MRRPILVALVLGGLVGPTAAADDPMTLGKDLYVERCVLCHGSNGHGWEWSEKVMRPPVPVPNLVETVPKSDDTYLRRVILDGGPAVGKTVFMPAFGFRMSDAEVDALIAYLRSVSAAAQQR